MLNKNGNNIIGDYNEDMFIVPDTQSCYTEIHCRIEIG